MRTLFIASLIGLCGCTRLSNTDRDSLVDGFSAAVNEKVTKPLEGSIAKVQGGVTNLEGKVTTLETGVEEAKARLKVLEDKKSSTPSSGESKKPSLSLKKALIMEEKKRQEEEDAIDRKRQAIREEKEEFSKFLRKYLESSRLTKEEKESIEEMKKIIEWQKRFLEEYEKELKKPKSSKKAIEGGRDHSAIVYGEWFIPPPSSVPLSVWNKLPMYVRSYPRKWGYWPERCPSGRTTFHVWYLDDAGVRREVPPWTE